MESEKRYSVNRALEGCLASWLMMFAGAMSVSLVLTPGLKLVSVDAERVIGIIIWFVAIFVGGYVAARRGKTTGWTNALVVSLFAQFFVLGKLPNDETFSELLKNPGPHWRQAVAAVLTIPAALAGGIVWQKSASKQQNSVGASSH